ncbi:MAG: prepilin-type N-terminal cleavage/methylation domain-containing protein [Gammaproteobacteria bacterium]|nr:prepilin-type N-terminal cleavage/methylation domain-containing protein [Gammaproteobacteria bacterium]NNF60019.1 prepilin-type N-terminal cleavage/methylation domain-containing protein [Gammaproteobacteria bacterium]NNM20077.1 prepilin-type N-terminal cleavage/methylation domain-containing protein [Gammaproteobacteria bacterium]
MSQRGFTLVELVIALTLTVIVTSFAAMFIAGPVQGYTDQNRRAGLVDSAESALHRMGRDIRSALPNSVRVVAVGSGFALEMLNTVDGARYRENPPPADTTKTLDFSAADDQFNAIGGFNRIAKPFSSTTHYLSIYNVGVTGANSWELANVITPPGTQIDIAADAIAGEDHVTLAAPFRFAYGSPSQRMYLINGPVTWLCEPAAGTLTRFDGYAIATDQTTRDSAAELTGAGATATRVADNISSCALNYAPGTAWRAGLVSARLAVAQASESIVLHHQVHIENAP